MNPNEIGVLVQTLRALQDAMAPGLAAIWPVLMGFLRLAIFVELVTIAVNILVVHANIPAQLLRLFLRISAVLGMMRAFPVILTTLIEESTKLGLLAGGNTVTVAQFMDPGAWLALGFKTVVPLMQAVQALSWYEYGLSAVYLLAWLVLMAAFAYMGLSLFVLQIQMTLALVGAQVLLPFACTRFTSWMARGAIAYPINCAFQFFFKALLASVAFSVLQRQATALGTFPADVAGRAQAVVVMAVLPLVFAVLFWKSGSIASGLLQGVPGLSAGHVLQAAAGTAVLASAGGAAAGGVARVLGSAARGTLQTTAGARMAYSIGSAARPGGPMTHVMGGMQGMAAAGRGLAASAVQSVTGAPLQALRQTLLAGRQAGYLHSGGTLPPGVRVAAGGPGAGSPRQSGAAQLRTTLQQTARFFGHDHEGGGVSPTL